MTTALPLAWAGCRQDCDTDFDVAGEAGVVGSSGHIGHTVKTFN